MDAHDVRRSGQLRALLVERAPRRARWCVAVRSGQAMGYRERHTGGRTVSWVRDRRATMARVFLVRHGETEWNRLGRRQGRLDSPLTDLGLVQAQEVAARAASLRIDAVFSSPLGRAATTAAIIAKPHRHEVVLIDHLQEIDHGDWSGLTNAEIDGRYPGERQRRAADHYWWRFPNGESYADADSRAAKALRRIRDANCLQPHLVTHEMFGRMLLRNLLGLDPAEALAKDHPHDVIYEVDVER
ncbi:MAG: histidine phosphatase family protein, partial [Acidimicrobiales bacterium]